MNVEQIDRAILSAVGNDWTAAAITVVKIGDSLGRKYRAVAERMRMLVDQQTLISDQDLAWGKGWIKAQVRKPNQSDTLS